MGRRTLIWNYSSGPSYATWDPSYTSIYNTLDSTKLVDTIASGSGTQYMLATVSKSTGKYYWEIYLTTYTSLQQIMIGVSGASPGTWIGNTTASWGVGAVFSTPYKIHNGGFTTYGVALNQGDIISVATDFGGGTINIYQNGTIVGSSPAWSGLSGTLYPAISNISSNGFVVTANFGQNSWDSRTSTLRSSLTGYTLGIY